MEISTQDDLFDHVDVEDPAYKRLRTFYGKNKNRDSSATKEAMDSAGRRKNQNESTVNINDESTLTDKLDGIIEEKTLSIVNVITNKQIDQYY